MNKAFVREPDEPDPRCPSCGGLGVAVGRATLAEHLPLEALPRLGSSACFCPSPRCPVAYFDANGASVPAEVLLRPAYPKDPDAPVCPCFGITRQQVEEDARAGLTEGVKMLIAKASSPQAQCLLRSPSGQSCVAEVQQIFLQAKQGKPAK